MISRISDTGANGLLGYELGAFPSRDAAVRARLRVATAQGPPVHKAVSAAPDDGDDEADLTRRISSTSMLRRIYDASGLSRSLTQAQHVQAGEIDTRR